MEKAERHNEGKLEWGLVQFETLHPMVKVLMFGAEKYAPDNWKKGLNKREILESLIRHATALLDGQVIDTESGLPHIGHIQCNASFYEYFNIYPEKEVPTKRELKKAQENK